MKVKMNQRGIITVDFLFAMVLILGMTSLMFVLTFTLSMASIVQYVTFAAARNYAPAHIDRASQEARGKAKYEELLNSKTFKPLFTNGWFTVDAAATFGDHTETIPALQGGIGTANEFWGASTGFIARILAFRIPFFGTTVPDGNESGEGFKTRITAFLGREPTEAECLDFTKQRWTAIRNLQVANGTGYSQGTSTNGYYPMTDDGC